MPGPGEPGPCVRRHGDLEGAAQIATAWKGHLRANRALRVRGGCRRGRRCR
jgi:hypothetical protein